jgi:hypothetical protein
MLVFLLIVSGVGAVLYGGLQGAFMANPILSGVIGGVVLLGVGFAFRMVLVLRPEIRWIKSFQADHPD